MREFQNCFMIRPVPFFKLRTKHLYFSPSVYQNHCDIAGWQLGKVAFVVVSNPIVAQRATFTSFGMRGWRILVWAALRNGINRCKSHHDLKGGKVLWFLGASLVWVHWVLQHQGFSRLWVLF